MLLRLSYHQNLKTSYNF